MDRWRADRGPVVDGGACAGRPAAAWAQLFGLIGFEVFGQFDRVVEDGDAFFAHAVAQLAHGVGLVDPARYRPGSGPGTPPGVGEMTTPG